MKLFYDDQALMHVAANSAFHERTKHIEVVCNYIRQQVQSTVIQTNYVHSSNQLTDAFTKVFTSAQFRQLLCKFGSINILAPT